MAMATFGRSINDPYVGEPSRVSMLCRDLLVRERPSDRSPYVAREIIRRLILDPGMDLLSIVPPPYEMADHPYTMVYDLLSGKSAFFETILEADDVLADELWLAVTEQLDRSPVSAEQATNSVLMVCIAEWTTRLLPVEPSPSMTTPDETRAATLTPHRIRTPLELFLPDSPLLNRFSMETTTQVQDFGASLHPRYINLISRFIMSLCSTTQFPSVNRLILVRYLCKQFHVFCLVSTPDTELAAVKAAIHTRPPFSAQLYSFLHSALEICPSPLIFRDVADVWLSWTRPWRYEPGGEEKPITHYAQFVLKHDKFYTVLLGKILRRMRELSVGAENARIMKSVFECAWRPPMAQAFALLGVDPQPPTVATVNAVRLKRDERKKALEELTEKNMNSSWWNQLIGTEEDVVIRQRQEEVNQLDDAVREAERRLGLSGSLDETPVGAPPPAATSLLYTTPRSRMAGLPDHERDPHTGIMHLTPEGRRQVISRERSFDFSPCQRTLPPVLRNIGRNEIAWLSARLAALSLWLSDSALVRRLARSYDEPSLLGHLSRLLLDPARPNPSHAAPFFRQVLPVTPAVLNLRFLARYSTLATIAFIYLVFFVSSWFFFLVPIGLFVVLIYTLLQSEF